MFLSRKLSGSSCSRLQQTLFAVGGSRLAFLLPSSTLGGGYLPLRHPLAAALGRKIGSLVKQKSGKKTETIKYGKFTGRQV